MKKSILAYGLSLLLTVTAAWAAPLIDIGPQYMLGTSASRRIPILVSSPTHERVEGLVLAVQIDDGGPVNGGTIATKPQITALDIIGAGTIFNASNNGATPQYLGSPSLIAMAETTTVSGDLEANGVLAYLTVNPAGTALGSYKIDLQNVAANVTGGPWTTDFAGVPASFPENDSYIYIVDLHQSVWNGVNGWWTDATWTDPQPPYPNYTTQAVVNTPYTVNVASAEEADSLALSNGGKVAIGSTGSLTITQSAVVSAGGTLSLASGAGLSAAGIQLSGGTLSGSGTVAPLVTLGGGTLSTPGGSDNLVLSLAPGGTGGLTKTGSGTALILSNVTYSGDTTISAGRLQFNGASSALDAVAGAGALGVGDGSTASLLTADSINVGVLTIAAGSTVTIAPIPGGPLSAGSTLTSVPEPSTLILLIAAALGAFFYGATTGRGFTRWIFKCT